ncbi:MAG: nucleotidyltransferase family protein [Pseudomonadota bacterium]
MPGPQDRADAIRHWPAPLRFLAASLSGRPRPALDAADWDQFADLAVERHRLAAPLAARLQGDDIPTRIRDALETASAQAALEALAQKAETLRLLDAFAAEDLMPVLLKGWPLAERLFGAAGMRQAKDIDLHIAPGELPRAVRVLEELGYRPHPAHLGRCALARRPSPALIAETNDIAWMHPSGQVVELHWRLTHLAGWIELAEIDAPLISHPLDATGHTLLVPGDRANLIYLSVHGQLHLWGRLRWLYDIARLMELRSTTDLEGDLAEAERVGAGRAVRIATHLAATVFAAPLPRDWPELDWLERRAMAQFLALIAGEGGRPGHRVARLGFYLSTLGLGEGLTQRLAAPRYALWRNLRLSLAERLG